MVLLWCEEKVLAVEFCLSAEPDKLMLALLGLATNHSWNAYRHGIPMGFLYQAISIQNTLGSISSEETKALGL